MKETDSIKHIKAFAKHKGYAVEEFEDGVAHKMMSTFLKDKSLVINLAPKYPDIYLVFYDSYATQTNVNSTFTGLFKISNTQYTGDVEILRKNPYDLLRFKKRLKTRDSYLDKKLCIYSKNHHFIKQEIDRHFIKDFDEINQSFENVSFHLDYDIIPFNASLKQKHLISLRIKEWIIDTKKLDQFIAIGSRILKRM